MQTLRRQPDAASIALAADILRGGGLVAFPTETVYGLGADACDERAVARIYAAKGRPPTNPIIVHTHDGSSARALTTAWPPQADALAKRFWPGPLTLVLPKSHAIPAIVTAGGPTVAVRVPAHPVALALLRAAGIPLAAPSANRSFALSPTRCEHVLRDLDGRVDLVIDGGPTPGGIESTVLDVTDSPACILRPGLVSRADIEAVIGRIEYAATPAAGRHGGEAPAMDAVGHEPLRSPGMLARHYAPRVPLELAPGPADALAAARRADGRRVGVVTFDDDPLPDAPGLVVLRLPASPAGYAAGMYAALHVLDATTDLIIVRLPPDSDDWLAIRDRLLRAAAG